MFVSTAAGCAWSWIASKAVTRSYATPSPGVATSCTTNCAFVSPSAPASARADSMASSEKSSPVNRLAGNVCARTLIACPLPQPMSATSMPARNRSVTPSTKGRIPSTRAASTTPALSSAISW